MNEYEYLKKLLEEYNKKFDDVFPLMMITGARRKSVIKEIEKCLKENKKYEIEIEEGVYY